MYIPKNKFITMHGHLSGTTYWVIRSIPQPQHRRRDLRQGRQRFRPWPPRSPPRLLPLRKIVPCKMIYFVKSYNRLSGTRRVEQYHHPNYMGATCHFRSSLNKYRYKYTLSSLFHSQNTISFQELLFLYYKYSHINVIESTSAKKTGLWNINNVET